MASTVPPFPSNGTGVASPLTWQSNVSRYNVIGRDPFPSDATGLAVGDLWRGLNGRWWQLTRAANAARGLAPLWTQLPSAGDMPGSIGPVAVCYATKRIVSAYTGPLFDITRLSDNAVLTVQQTAKGLPDISAMAGFIGNSVGYYTKAYDQNGSANHATQTVLANAKIVDLSDLQGGAPTFVCNTAQRDYLAGLLASTLTVTGYTGNVLTISAGLPKFLAPGMSISGTNVPSGGIMTATAVNGQNVTVASIPAGVAVGMGVGWGTGSIGTTAIAAGTVISAIDTTNKILTISGSVPPPLTTGGVTLSVNAVNLITALTPTTITLQVAPTAAPGILTIGVPPVWFDIPAAVSVSFQNCGFAAVIRPGGNALQGNWLMLGQSAVQPFTGNIGTSLPGFGLMKILPTAASDSLRVIVGNGATNITATGIKHIPQGADYFAAAQSGTTLTWTLGRKKGSQTQGGQSGLTLAGGSFGFHQQIANPLSRTEDVEFCALIIYSAAPTAAQQLQAQLACYEAFDIHPQPRANIVGWGSSTSQGQGVISARSAPAFKSKVMMGATMPGTYWCAGDGNGVAQANANNYPALCYQPSAPLNLCIYHPGLGNSISANETASQVYAEIVAGVGLLRAAGYKRVHLTKSASRAVFSAPQLLQFRIASVFCNALIPGIVDTYANLESDPVFGGDPAPMTVTAVDSANNIVTVNSPSTYATAGNYVEWAGMPFSVAGNTGAVTITAVNGNALTLSGAVTGLKIGSTLNALNPTPWTTYPAYWQTDGQHFTDAGYSAHCLMAFNQMIAAQIIG